jgi:hypothetical protein
MIISISQAFDRERRGLTCAIATCKSRMNVERQNPYESPNETNAAKAGRLHPLMRGIALVTIILIGAWFALWLTVAFLHWLDTFGP